MGIDYLKGIIKKLPDDNNAKYIKIMVSAKERMKILNEILADFGGIENVDLHAELGKRLTAIERNKMRMPKFNPHIPGTVPISAPISTQTTPSATQSQNGANLAQPEPTEKPKVNIGMNTEKE